MVGNSDSEFFCMRHCVSYDHATSPIQLTRRERIQSAEFVLKRRRERSPSNKDMLPHEPDIRQLKDDSSMVLVRRAAGSQS